MIAARRVFRAVALATAAVLLAAMAAGCATGARSSPPRSAAQLAQPTAWQRTLDQIEPDGSVSAATALAAFALAIGPVPGARPLPGTAQAIPSGTIAVQWVFGHWSALTSGQRRAVLADLGVPGDKTSLTSLIEPVTGSAPAAGANAGASPNVPCLTADAGAAGPYRAQLAGIESDIVAHVGDGPFTPDVYFAVNTKQLEGKSKMYTYGCQGTTPTSGGPVSGCTIHVNPLISGFSAADVHDFLIHELTHCYLFLKLGGAYAAMPSWYVEGVPTWAMTVLGNGSDLGSSYWLTYLDTPGTPLFSRAYPALGYFVHLAETGTDIWQKIIPMGEAIKSGGSDAGWEAADPTTDFLDSWGSGYAEGRYPGTAWATSGPNLPAYQGPISQQSVGDGQTVTVSAPKAAVGISHVDLNAQVVVFDSSSSASGRISLDDGDDTTLDQAADAYTTGSQDSCPSGSADAGARLTPLTSGQHYVSVTGGLDAASVRVEGMSLASFCARPGAANCLVGTWITAEVQVTLPGQFTEKGGAGVTMRISADGATTIDFDGMSSIDATGSAFTADYVFGGQITGQLVLPKTIPPGSLFALPAAPGGGYDDSRLTVTIHIASPISDTLGPMPISELVGEMGSSGSSVNADPAGEGTWSCSGNTLINRGPSSLPSYGTWTWTRSS